MRKLLVLVCALGLAGALYAAGPFSGTWKLNTDKSKFQSGPAPQEETVTVREANGTTDVTVAGTDQSGKPVAVHFTHPTSGGPVTYLEGGPTDGSTESVRQVNAHTRRQTTMRDGKRVGTEMITISADGKTLRVESKGTLASGKAFTDLEVLDKQ
jgi:hypothetical protein